VNSVYSQSSDDGSGPNKCIQRSRNAGAMVSPVALARLGRTAVSVVDELGLELLD
jgi:hypothetical protein